MRSFRQNWTKLQYDFFKATECTRKFLASLVAKVLETRRPPSLRTQFSRVVVFILLISKHHYPERPGMALLLLVLFFISLLLSSLSSCEVEQGEKSKEVLIHADEGERHKQGTKYFATLCAGLATSSGNRFFSLLICWWFYFARMFREFLSHGQTVR